MRLIGTLKDRDDTIRAMRSVINELEFNKRSNEATIAKMKIEYEQLVDRHTKLQEELSYSVK